MDDSTNAVGGRATTPRPPGATDDDHDRGLSRRRLLGLLGVGGVAGAGYVLRGTLDVGPLEPLAGSGASPGRTVQTAEGTGLARWSDPATWRGQVPDAASVAIVDRPVLLDVDTQVDGVRIGPEGELVFEPESSRTLRSTANVEVEGALAMKPHDVTVVHRLGFPEVDEEAFVGGHTEVVQASDVGLWVMGAGTLDLAGAKKTVWTRAATAVPAGADSLTVDEAAGWRAGDEIVVTPTEPATTPGYAEHHDRRVIAEVDGNTITLDRPLDHPHPEVEVRPGVVHRAEVLNLTRNVLVEGGERGRPHVMVQAAAPQSISYVGLRRLGPQQQGAGVLGRYVVHFHEVGDGARGSLVEGAVAYEGGNHAFVAHLSHGVTFRDCIAHDMAETPYWWDLSFEEDKGLIPSHDTTYERSVAHYVRPGGDKVQLAGFQLGAGRGNVARGCVASGILGTGTHATAGFNWPSRSRDEHPWIFEDNVAHNSVGGGIYFWQNHVGRTITDRFTVYHSRHGIWAGGYRNIASYRDSVVYACSETGLRITAVPGSHGAEPIFYEGMYVDQADLTDFAAEIGESIVATDVETMVSRSTFKGGRRAQVGLPHGGDLNQLYRFEDCVFDGNELWLADDVPANTRLQVIDDQRALLVQRADRPGERIPRWNASIRELERVNP